MGRVFRMQVSKLQGYACPSCDLSRTSDSITWLVVLPLLCLTALLGCSNTQSGRTTVEVSGIVTLDGTPLDGANVLFAPDVGSDDGRLPSQAVTDNEGKFNLRTHVGGGKFQSGIAPGKYAVT